MKKKSKITRTPGANSVERWLRPLRTGLLLGGAGAVAIWACSAQLQEEPRGHGIATPLAADTSAAEPVVAAPRPPLDLADFAPLLLANDELREVHLAVTEERFGDAAELYTRALMHAESSGVIGPEQDYQLARLLEWAEKSSEAVARYDRSSRKPWLLRDYATYFSARLALQVGDARGARLRLSKFPDGLPISDDARLTRAEAELALGAAGDARATLAALRARAPHSRGWERVNLLFARAVLASSATSRTVADLVFALEGVRDIGAHLPGTRIGKAAVEEEHKLLAALPPEEFEKRRSLGATEQLQRLSALLDTRQNEDALIAAKELLATPSLAASVRCEATYFRAKAMAGLKQWGKGADLLGDVAGRCEAQEVYPKMLYLAGKYSQYDKRFSQAARYFQTLEQNAPSSSLVDDARILRAKSHLELGDEARFTQLLQSLAADYPDGDMVLDGVFELALRRMERGDWSGTANVLSSVVSAAIRADAHREHEWAGRERYFLARAHFELGDQESCWSQFETLIRQRPLSYYMQHAYSRLLEVDPERALRAREAGLTQAREQPFEFEHRSGFDSPGFARALELLRLGDVEYAQRELTAEGADDTDLLWALALLYSRSGAPKLSQQLVRGRLKEWLGKWPDGDWVEPWELAFPRPYRELVSKAARENDLPESWIYAVMREESGFDPRVVSHADAYGLMQLILPTAKHFAKKVGLPHGPAALKRPSVNIALGANALASFRSRFPNNPLLAIPGYNAGPGRPRRWLSERPNVDFDLWVELIPFTETRRYTKRVLASRGAYTFLYSGAGARDALLPRRLHTQP